MNKNLVSAASLVKSMALILFGMIISIIFLLHWAKIHQSDSDPKNISYILWQLGDNPNMNLDHAMTAMVGDSWAARNLRGMTTQELRKRFGYLLDVQQVRPYDQYCYATAESVGQFGTHARGRAVLFLRDSDWMVILDQDRAIDLVLCKGL